MKRLEYVNGVTVDRRNDGPVLVMDIKPRKVYSSSMFWNKNMIIKFYKIVDQVIIFPEVADALELDESNNRIYSNKHFGIRLTKDCSYAYIWLKEGPHL